MPGMDWCEIVMEEYKTLREESLASIQTQNTIITYGTTAIGLAFGGGITVWDRDIVSALIFLVLIPTLTYLILLGWLGEVGRMFRAGVFLSVLERKINAQFPDKPPALSWETWLAKGEWKRKTPYRIISFHYRAIAGIFLFGVLAAISIGNFKIPFPVASTLWLSVNVAEILVFAFVLYTCWRTANTIEHGSDVSSLIRTIT